jgi:hypothetical protein
LWPQTRRRSRRRWSLLWTTQVRVPLDFSDRWRLAHRQPSRSRFCWPCIVCVAFLWQRATARCACCAGLAYDGRLVVDAGLSTPADPRVFAAGPLAKFSRAAGGELHAGLSSAELGAALADAVLRATTALLGLPQPVSGEAAARRAAAGAPPALHAGAPRACALYGGARFALAVAPRRVSAPGAPPAPGGSLVATRTARGMCRVLLDAAGCIELVAFLGPEPTDPAASGPTALQAASLIGLPATLLSPDLAADVASGAVPCLAALLAAPWFSAAFHGAFRPLLIDTAAVVSAARAAADRGQQWSGATGQEREIVATKAALADCQDAVAKFLDMFASDLPAYLTAH